MKPPPSAPMPTSLPPNDEEQEFAAFAATQNPVDLAAATWATRRREGLDATAAAEFRTWLAADPAHAGALADMELFVGALRRCPPPDAGPPARPGRRRLLKKLAPQAAAAMIACVVLGAGWLGRDAWHGQLLSVQSYATARGELAETHLADGSRMQLDTATRAEVRFYRDRREVHLADGQAMFAVRADAGRPFHVLAGGLRITVVGTRFAVRHTATGLDADAVRVTVEEGRVRVVRAATAEQRELTAGETVLAVAGASLGPVAGVPADGVGAWRDGRVSFDNTRLDHALAEFERYGRTGLAIRDPAVAALRIGGSFNLRQFDAFKQILPQLLPVRLEPRGETTDIAAAR